MKPRPTGGSTHPPRAGRGRCRLLRPSSRHASGWGPTASVCRGWALSRINKGTIEEAIEWVKRCPDPLPGGEAEIEIRQVFEASDFETMTPELREQEERLRATVESRRSTS